MNKKIIYTDTSHKNLKITAGKNEDITYVILMAGSGNCRKELNINISATGSTVKVLIFIIRFGNGNITLNTLQNHQYKFGKSEITVRSVLFDQAKLNFQGLIKIESHAQKTSAYLENRNLILSEKAKVTTRPFLEILSNDVYCKHAVTVGRPDKDELHYLTCRGLSENAAKSLLVKGFLYECLDKINDKKIQDKVMAKSEKVIDSIL